ncbi:MAG: NADH-quinone oxidoreductase subunit J, partial [Thermomicrobiales bacterium]
SIGAVGTASPAAIEAVGGNVQAIGRSIYTNYLLAFEITSLVLTVGVIGAIVLALPERLGERLGTARSTISLAHSRGADDALPEGPRGETPIQVDTTRPDPTPHSVRRVIMAKEADDYTSVGDASRRARD